LVTAKIKIWEYYNEYESVTQETLMTVNRTAVLFIQDDYCK